ncbi:hypothetical protein BS50DRAFT_402238 [Corynespora cassiicola Philippines]|uniref:Uncharacterized protein n=1 Tax=Corynespora cassiicola Philippines TaxID=1448308 RepID=A0A2T2NKK3_CORCC|nr:hypothetical protein BS50DRAFT_402238 [Corynespora cassiicola Philippines]
MKRRRVDNLFGVVILVPGVWIMSSTNTCNTSTEDTWLSYVPSLPFIFSLFYKPSTPKSLLSLCEASCKSLSYLSCALHVDSCFMLLDIPIMELGSPQTHLGTYGNEYQIHQIAFHVTKSFPEIDMNALPPSVPEYFPFQASSGTSSSSLRLPLLRHLYFITDIHGSQVQ